MHLEELILRVKILKLGQVEVFLRHVPEPPEVCLRTVRDNSAFFPVHKVVFPRFLSIQFTLMSFYVRNIT